MTVLSPPTHQACRKLAWGWSLPEIGLGLGGVALAGLVVLFGIKLLRFLPATLVNAAIDPHYVANRAKV